MRAGSRLYELPRHAFQLADIFIAKLLERRRRQVDVVVPASRALVDHAHVHGLAMPGHGSRLSTQGAFTTVGGFFPEGLADSDDVLAVFVVPAARATTARRAVVCSPSVVDAVAATASIELHFANRGTNYNRSSEDGPGKGESR